MLARRLCGLLRFRTCRDLFDLINVRSNSDRRYCSCAMSVGSSRKATFTKKRFNSDVIKRLSECFERSAVSWRRISMRSSVSRSGCFLVLACQTVTTGRTEYDGAATSPVGDRTRTISGVRDSKAPERGRNHALELSLMSLLQVNSGTGASKQATERWPGLRRHFWL